MSDATDPVASPKTTGRSRVLVVSLLVVLFLARHDLWWWADATLVGGLPVGLASQVLVCVLAIPLFAAASRAFGVEDNPS